MQKLSSELVGRPIVSVQSSQHLGTLTGFILSNEDLKIVACTVAVPGTKNVHYLLPNDIRFFNAQKILVDSHQNLSEFADLVRYQHTITDNYMLIGKKVETTAGKKLGKVTSFLFDPAHYYVTKLGVTPPLFKKFLVTHLLIDRADIIETKKNTIIVKENVAKIKKSAPAVLPQRS